MLKVGLIVDEGELPYIAHDLISRSEKADHYHIECLIVQKVNHVHGANAIEKIWRSVKVRGFSATFSLLSFLAIEKFEKHVVSTKEVYRQAFRCLSPNTFSIDTIDCTPQVSDSGFVYRYCTSDLEKINSRNLDLLVRCGSGILRGEILSVCRLGIMSIHHGDNSRYRGGPPGFWEVFHRSPVTGFIVQILTDELDGGDVLLRGSIATTSIATLNHARVLIKANVFLHQLLERIGKSGTQLTALPNTPYCHPLYSIPKPGVQFVYLAKSFLHISKRLADRIFGKELQWGVSYRYVKDWKDTVLWKAVEIENPVGRFFADPFVTSKDGQHVCFVEDYNYSEEKAKITAIAINPEGYEILGTALEEDFHLSYPFVFKSDGELYMCPETRSINEIRLYRCAEFPLKWQLHQVLLKNIAAVDTTIIEYNGKWWLFTNQDSAGLEDFGSELHLYQANSLKSEQWISHPSNPVVFDSLTGRNAGLIKQGGSNYRVSQSQGFDFYGKGVTIHNISELNLHTFSEAELASITANYAPGIKGIHTFNYCDGVVAFDHVSLKTR